MMDADIENVSKILEAIPQISAICLDVANGYSEHFVEFVKKTRAKFPEHILMVCDITGGCVEHSEEIVYYVSLND